LFICRRSGESKKDQDDGIDTIKGDHAGPSVYPDSVLVKSPLLIVESSDEFDCIRSALNHEIRPNGIIEHMYVADIAQLVWEILRLRRCKVSIINLAFRPALEKLTAQLLRDPGQQEYLVRDEAEKLAEAWFSKDTAKRKISGLLDYFHLDESAIEAEAIRRSAEDIELLDRLLASLESRRDKALRRIAEYRSDLGRQMRKAADRIIDGKALVLEDASSARPPEAA
jgi:hypothetical protein